MKNIIWVLMLIPAISASQPIHIDSFNGIRFGSSKEEALQVIKSLGGSLTSFNELEELAYLSDINFEGKNSKRSYLKFVDNKLYEGIVEFDVTHLNYRELYNSIKFALSEKYGYGKDFSWMEHPCYFNDGTEYNAILARRGKLCHVWASKAQVTSGDFIVMEVGADRVLRIVFQNHFLATITSQKNRQLGANNK